MQGIKKPCYLLGIMSVTDASALRQIMDMEEEDEAIREKAQSLIETVIKGVKEQLEALQKKEREADYVIGNIQWIACKDFTVERGRQQIEEYISQTWEFHESWLHWSDFLKEEQLKYSKRYHYRVRWSIPTCRKPIPQATACIYFIVEISNIKPPTLPIEVFFILESNRLIHRPGRCRFREKWLKDIIESKMILMESITF
ncbi:A-kinase anchor protein 14 isoform A [Alligator mississippiensis]|uniref:A-kinase anchor protein 14 isoform A n=2 Tax=Alligator mississippiensis TaxID=8496 RepID=A0A151NN69_ALLMI|nr:A-kinase anchor protein 14 isoform A [Alligator mississippiensis]